MAQFCDMIAGTSTGGIIALGLGLNKSAPEIERLYVEDSKNIFCETWSRYRLLRLLKQSFMSLHDHRELERALYTTFQDSRLGDSICRLVIPAFLGPKADVAVFKTDHHSDFKEDWRMAAWEVARATSAAPTFFAGHQGDGHFFLDGGVWANNPIMCAIVDALSAYDISPAQIRVLSIGTGNNPTVMSKWAVAGGFIAWKTIIKTAMYLTTDNAQGQACLLLGPDNITRLEPSKQSGEIELDDRRRSVEALLPEAESTFALNLEALRDFFAETVPPRERHYT